MSEPQGNLHTRAMTIQALPASIAAAASMAVLITLSFWNFELRSLLRLSWQSGALSVVIWLAVYFLFYRKHRQPVEINLMAFMISAIAAIFLSYQVIPPQNPMSRYIGIMVIASAAFVVFYFTCLQALFSITRINENSLFLSMALICGLAGMLIILINSLSARMYGDDFYYAIQLRQLGLWKAVIWFYSNWSASFFSNFLIIGLSDKYRAILVFLVLDIMAIFMSWVLATDKKSLNRWLSAAAAALFIPLAVLTVTPDMYKSLFWICSTLSLLPFLILIPIYLVLVGRIYSGRQPISRIHLVAAVLLSFAISTTHEVASLGWLSMHAFGILWFHLSGSKQRGLKRFLVAGLLGTLIGLAVLLASPGVAARVSEQNYPPPPPIPEILLNTFTHFFDFLRLVSAPYYQFHGDTRPGWFLIIAAAGLGWLSDAPFRRRYAHAGLLLACAVGMAAISFFPGAYIMSMPIPFRTQFIPSLYLVLGAFIFGLFLPRPAHQQIKTALTVLIALVLFFGSRTGIRQLLLTMDPVRQYAADWDARDAHVRLTGQEPERIEVPWDEYEQEFDTIKDYYRILVNSR